jgi:alkanesulfonate monooxygenase SsuD/methylene tetrahydromethanopterin reductase-like flavin-dependent oxidoreductase (luciferase family)
MQPNHVSLVIAELFGMLEALHPGRIDLGIGRAPGTEQVTAAADAGQPFRRLTGHQPSLPQPPRQQRRARPRSSYPYRRSS